MVRLGISRDPIILRILDHLDTPNFLLAFLFMPLRIRGSSEVMNCVTSVKGLEESSVYSLPEPMNL